MPTSKRPGEQRIEGARVILADLREEFERGVNADFNGALMQEVIRRFEWIIELAERLTLEERKRRAEASDDERRTFIREAVLWCRIDTRDDAEAWKQARAVWDAKPEDC